MRSSEGVEDMTIVLVGIALFLYGAIVGLVGPRLGTALSVLPPVLFFVLLANARTDAELDAVTGGLMVGLFAFLAGVRLTERGSVPKGKQRRSAIDG
jgi:cell division protein FtsW (lipid II flippase)